MKKVYLLIATVLYLLATMILCTKNHKNNKHTFGPTNSIPRNLSWETIQKKQNDLCPKKFTDVPAIYICELYLAEHIENQSITRKEYNIKVYD